MEAQPPPLPPGKPRTLDYRSPASSPPGGMDPTKVFDTVTGPNLRLRDNLVQLAAVVVGAGLGALAGFLLLDDATAGIALGGIAGLVAGLLLSGIVIGIVRFITAVRK